MNVKLPFSCAIAAGALVAPQLVNASYVFKDIDLSAAGYTTGPVSGVNKNMTFIATGIPTVQPGPQVGLVFASTGTWSFSVLGAKNLYISHVANNGTMIGFYTDAGNNMHGFAVYKGVVNRFNHPNADWTMGISVDERGHLLGAFEDPLGIHAFEFYAGVYHDFSLWRANETYFMDENNSDVILGRYVAGDTTGGFLLNKYGAIAPVVIPNATQVYVEGLTSLTQNVVGYYQMAGTPDLHGFVQNPLGVNTVLDYPWPPTISQDFGSGLETLALWHAYTVPSGINDSGIVVGNASATYHNAKHQATVRAMFTATPSGP